MNYKKIIYMCIAIIIAVYVLYRFIGNDLQGNRNTSQPQVQTSLTTQTSEGAVTVAVTPKTLTSDSQAIFDVQLNTHSVELNYDLAQIAKLTDDSGNSYKPSSWSGGKGGHHVEGILTFPSISKSAKKVILTIPGIDSTDRVFKWDVK